MPNNIYIVGFMGTGKTAVAKALSKRLGLTFVDLDDMIEEKEGLKIVDIFAQKGEPYFRDLESAVLREVASQGGYAAACGGGIVLRDENLETMENSGAVVCLDASPEAIYQRTRHAAHRPLLNVEDPKAAIKELLDKRAHFYAKIEYHIDTSEFTVDEVVDRIVERIKMQK